MPKESRKSEHPGVYIRRHVIPSKMSVTAAAKLLGVGRPALSNLLNAKAALSFEMAIRLEKTFGEDHKELLDRQATFDHHERRGQERFIAARRYVPPFLPASLTIKARQIENWAERLDARQTLAVLLRRLIHSTGCELHQVDFPGYDNAERKGWDGLLEAGVATPWIPEGISRWEFSANRNPARKAEMDYAARVRSVSPVERRECVFVFVTPRNWPGKTKWAKRKQRERVWKAVRAYDASDLEQWLEDSMPAQIWLAERLEMPVDGFETLDRFWERWAEASVPAITPVIFDPSITTFRGKFKNWFKKQSEKPFSVAADSRDEAIAYLACLFRDTTVGKRSGDLAIVFKSAQALRKLATSQAPFIPIVSTEEAERELGSLCKRLHCLTVHPRNAINLTPDVALDRLDHDGFMKALGEMGFDRDNAVRLGRESGRSPTILRRRLSKISGIKIPQWAKDVEISRSLIPMAFVGSWRADSSSDCKILERLSDHDYGEVERHIRCLLQFEDSPVWSVANHRGVASQIDALFAISWQITNEDVDQFFRIARDVLSEPDPALELRENKRWTAALHGKVRKHSAAMRQGICDTLVILSIHGDDLFRDQLGVDVEAQVSRLVRSLLTPLDLNKLLSHRNELPCYAEAAPDEFMRLLETALRQTPPVVLGLLKPTESGPFGGCPRTGLLWALECLAWKHLGRVNAILGQMSKTVIDDNWVNKPINSLQAIYRSWMPQTAVSLEDRIRALDALTNRFPDVGWQICIEQFKGGPRFGDYSYRPRWRSDASGEGHVVTQKELCNFALKVLEIMLTWPSHNEKTLGDLVECLPRIFEKDHTKVWNLINKWSGSEVDERAKAGLAERIRRSMFARPSQNNRLNRAAKDRARIAYENLQPKDPVVRHAWLFAVHWIWCSAEIGEDGEIDYDKHDENIDIRRRAAMNEIWTRRGHEGVTALLSDGGMPSLVGRYIALILSRPNDHVDFLLQILSGRGPHEAVIDDCIQGFLHFLDPEACIGSLKFVVDNSNMDQMLRLFRCAPFRQDTWRLVGQYGEEVQSRYWLEVVPDSTQDSKSELKEIIDRLLEVKRPRAAFRAVQFHWSRVDTSRLKRLLLAVSMESAEPAGHYLPDPYYVSTALTALEGRSGISLEEMARLEFAYIKALDHSERGIPHLERLIAGSPAMFVQFLAIFSKRRDDGQDPPEWRIENREQREIWATSALSVFDQINYLPGTGTDGRINTEELLAWVTQVRRLCAEYGRAEIGDQYVGQLLSKAPAEESGDWPCLPVCEVMESISAQHIGAGFLVGVIGARGVTSRGLSDGGAQERTLAAKYRKMADQLVFDFPYVSSVLKNIAVDYEHQAEWHDSEVKIRERLE